MNEYEVRGIVRDELRMEREKREAAERVAEARAALQRAEIDKNAVDEKFRALVIRENSAMLQDHFGGKQ